MIDKNLHKKKNCYTCKYMSIGSTMDWSDYCNYQNYMPINNKTFECVYYKRSLWDKILSLFARDVDLSDNVK